MSSADVGGLDARMAGAARGAALDRVQGDAVSSGVAVELEQEWRKRFSIVHRYRLVGAEHSIPVYVKAPLGRPDRTGPEWPKLVSVEPVGSPARLQARALADLAAAVDRLGDPLIGSVRILPSPHDDLIVMTAAQGRPLRHHLLQHVRWRRTAERNDLDPVLRRVGTLLRLFHDTVLRPDQPADLVDRGTVTDGVRRLVAHLGEATGSSTVPLLGQRIVAGIERHLPDELTVTTRFGDFGLTNLIVDDNGCVTAIDTLAALRTPPLHDATYFTTAILGLRPQLASGDTAIPSATVEGWLSSFWSGYLENRTPPTGAIALWSSIRLLERWAAKSTRSGNPLVRRARSAVVDRGMERVIERCINDFEAAEPRPELVNNLVVG